MTKSVGTSVDYKCPNCGAAIFYNPKFKKWRCDYCRSVFTLDDLKKIKKNQKLEADTNSTNTEYVSYICQDCGAEIIADEETTATFCLYCKNTAILKNKLTGKFAPDYIIPFKKEKEVAIETFKNISKGRILTPKDFNNENNIENIRGIYIPFWLYDINVDGDIVIDAKHVTSWSSGNYRYTKVSTYSLIRDGSIKFYNIPVDGSTRFNNDIMNTLEPFDFNELEEFNHGYLSGFFAEKYDQDADSLYNIVANRAVNSTKNLMFNDTRPYSSKVIVKDNLNAIPLQKKYALLPVWMANVKYKDKLYLFAMNGQTGEFIGDIPIDKRKAVLIGIAIYIGTFTIIGIVSYLAYIFGWLS